MWVWPLLIVIGLALMGYVAVRLVRDRSTGNATSATARQILDDRFARGEIDEPEYRRRREGLRLARRSAAAAPSRSAARA